MAPEVFQDGTTQYDEKCDLFSAGVVFYELYNIRIHFFRLTGKNPFKKYTTNLENLLEVN